MKLRMIDRILIALSGLFLLALSAWLALEAMGKLQPLPAYLMGLMSVGARRGAFIFAGACAVPALLGVFDFFVLFRRRKGKRGFIAQRSENGEIAISVKTIETLVVKCAQKHGEIAVQSVTVEEERNGLLIKLRAALPNGMNIPLAVGTLQKQIKQYITACSGVDVSEVRVKVESTDRAVASSTYAVSDDTPALPVEQPEPAPIPVEAVTPVEMPAEPNGPVAEERELLTHQRIFSAEEEPAIVPAPPVMTVEAAEPEPEGIAEAAEEPAAEAAEPVAEAVEQEDAAIAPEELPEEADAPETAADEADEDDKWPSEPSEYTE